jgi:hypothetical protein
MGIRTTILSLRISWIIERIAKIQNIRHTSGYSKSEAQRRISILGPKLDKLMQRRRVLWERERKESFIESITKQVIIICLVGAACLLYLAFQV